MLSLDAAGGTGRDRSRSMVFRRRCAGLSGVSLGLALVFAAGSSEAVEPTGYLDNAGCDAIAGWAQDPDEPAVGIAVHLYLGGPAGSGVPAVGVTANLYREDLCAAIGSCEHGFWMPVPLSLLDGQPRNIHAYGIDSMGGPNPQLGNSPKVLQCAPSASGVRRPVTEVGAVDAWKFSQLWDVLPLPAAEAGALAKGPELPETPVLVTPDDGSGALWLLDSGVRRAVSAAAAGAWRFEPGKAAVKPAAEIQAIVEGPAVRGRPVLVMFEGLALIDDPLPEVPQGTTSSSGAGGSEGEGGGGGGSAGGAGGSGQDAGSGGSSDAPGGCAVAGDRGRGEDACSMLAGAALALLAGWRRSRARRAVRGRPEGSG